MKDVPNGEALLIHPPYVHYEGDFMRDPSPFLPVGLLYAGEMLERSGSARVAYHDFQLRDLNGKYVEGYDSFGITVMGTQNIAPAHQVYGSLVGRGVDPSKISVGGQGVEGLSQEEFERVFPGANQTSRGSLMGSPSYWNADLRKQIGKFSDQDLRTYLGSELTLLVSQGCLFSCTFCGAQTRQPETFYNTRDNLDYLLERARGLGLEGLAFYCTSLDFFQQALKGGDIRKLERVLKDIAALKDRHGITVRLRALTRADSYLEATESQELLNLVKAAGFTTLGFGADGAANIALLRAIRKGTGNLGYQLLRAFEHAEESGFVPEILYVFGIPEDTEETLQQTRDLCADLLRRFPTSVYRGFPAKNWIPGNPNWREDQQWRGSPAQGKLLSDPSLFLNLGFEALANPLSHPNPQARKLTNKYAIEMSLQAHKLGRVQSFLTVPIMETDGHELMDEGSFEALREIISNYAPDIAPHLTLENLSEYRKELNRRIPKDK